jgi:hypothetical protein
VRLRTLLADMWGEANVKLLLSNDMTGEWTVAYLDSNNCPYDGMLTINKVLGEGSYAGSMRLLTCSKQTVTQDALVKVTGSDVDIQFSNPRFSGGGYNADHYTLRRVSASQMKGNNRDTRGSGGQATLTKK